MRKARRAAACAAVAAAFGVVSTEAATLNYDPFAYLAGGGLTGQNGGSGWNGGWITTGTSQDNTLAAVGGSLSYPVPYEVPSSQPPTPQAMPKLRFSSDGRVSNPP